jgi:alpha-L-fucosidase
LVKPFVDACHKYGLKVGLYFSPRNWRIERGYRSYSQGSKGTPEKPHLDVDYKPTTLKKRDEELEEKYRTINRGQLEELLTHYGKIDLLWFDGGTAYVSTEQIRKWQPGIIINNRTNDVTADYDSSFEGAHLPEERPAGWWEACQTAIGSWGYRKAVDDIATPASQILTQFIKLRTWGGNYLINFGPRADGTLPDIYYERMKEIGNWMAANHNAVIGTQAGPYPQQCTVPVTTTDHIWYLFALPEFTEEKIILTGVPKPKKVLFKCQEISYSFDETRIEIVLPKGKRSELPDVVQIEW